MSTKRRKKKIEKRASNHIEKLNLCYNTPTMCTSSCIALHCSPYVMPGFDSISHYSLYEFSLSVLVIVVILHYRIILFLHIRMYFGSILRNGVEINHIYVFRFAFPLYLLSIPCLPSYSSYLRQYVWRIKTCSTIWYQRSAPKTNFPRHRRSLSLALSSLHLAPMVIAVVVIVVAFLFFHFLHLSHSA